ncbi:hypothetical protein Y032_0121g995 [Ancylostoma ceylanicum]|uniref:Uncharacterized protein n=1 Tax=Ancylostoma ceylanicum TaxID=53326 RepID=A0A016TAJ6_9BILA|nr:hypothetical protein Y032_0121g995 [Ancylostoma ceylanicum]
MPEPEGEPMESAEPTATEEGDVQDMVDENSDSNAGDSAPDATDSGDYGGDPEIPEEALSSSAVIVSLTSIVIAAMFI